MADVDYKAVKTHPISKRNDGSTGHRPHSNEEEYKKMYERSIKDPIGFWDEVSLPACPSLRDVRQEGGESGGRRGRVGARHGDAGGACALACCSRACRHQAEPRDLH
jgi:hypothetical protein